MRIRFARRPPLFRGEKSTKLSPPSADNSLDQAAFRRTTPAARMRPISARRASADMRSGHRGLGPEIGPSGLGDMATFRDWDDPSKCMAKTEKHKYFNILWTASTCANPSVFLRTRSFFSMTSADSLRRESARVVAHELVERVERRLFLQLGHLPPRRCAVGIEQQRNRHLVPG